MRQSQVGHSHELYIHVHQPGKVSHAIGRESFEKYSTATDREPRWKFLAPLADLDHYQTDKRTALYFISWFAGGLRLKVRAVISSIDCQYVSLSNNCGEMYSATIALVQT